MITVHVDNFQALGNVDLTLKGLTVLTGPSDRGKSALLRALESALFNRSGDAFVRLGQTHAAVDLKLPSYHNDPSVAPLHVHWEKGKGRNQFTVDGTTYAKVGTKAPPVLAQLGFRDEIIGGRVNDEGKLEGGIVMRPQMARQFDPIFLLDQTVTGSFLSEVMVKLSRLSMLQRANRACTADLRSTKSTLAVRQADAEATRAAADKLKPVVDVRERVQKLVEQAETLYAASDKLRLLRGLVEQRRAVLAVATVSLPQCTPEPRPLLKMFGKWEQLKALQVQRASTAAGMVKLPTRLKLKKSVQEAMQQYRQLRPLMIDQRQHRNWVNQYEAEALRHDDEHLQWAKALDDLKKQLKVCPMCEKPF